VKALPSLPDEPQLREARDRRGRLSWRLPDGRTVGWYWRDQRALVKPITARHLFGNKPGIAWNLELIALADRLRPRPKKLVARRTDRREASEGEPYGTYSVPFEVARRFAQAVLEGDLRFAVEEDADLQVLIPWTAWNGQVDGPDSPVEEPEEEGAPEQAALRGMG
jgi:hypothetical protein